MAAVPGKFVAAQGRPEQIIQSRIANFREIGTAYKHITDELKSRRPDLPRIQESAQLIENRGADMLLWFPPGSEPPPEPSKSWLDTILGWFCSEDSLSLPGEAKSHAKRAIWAQRAKFEQAHDKFNTAADRMLRAAEGGQPAAISAQFRRLGETCKGCHDVYREKVD